MSRLLFLLCLLFAFTLVNGSDDDHDGHDHGGTVTTAAADDHDGHDHDDDDDDHDGHDHDDDADDHDGHDHDDDDDHDGHDHDSDAEQLNDGHDGDDHDDHDGHDHSGDHDGHDHGDEHKEADAGLVIGACFVVTFISCTGVILMAPLSAFARKRNLKLDDFIYSFSAGCLLSTASFLMLPEAGHLTTAGSESEGEASTAYGLSVPGGYLVGAIIHWTCELIAGGGDGYKVSPRDADVEAPEKAVANEESAVSTETPQKEAKGCFGIAPVVWSVLWGDFFHNFADGIAIGAAFAACDETMGWVVVTGTVLHELSQEVADHMVLTKNGLSPIVAVALNFLSGISCVIGGAITLSTELDNKVVGCMLALGAGTYMWIACTEAFNKIMEVDSFKQILIRLSMFILGALLIGLVLLEHEHCA